MVLIADRLKHKEQVKNSILEATKLIVLQEGWQAVSIRKIADSIGYSLPMVYKFFESKDALLEEFVVQGFDMLGNLMLNTKNQANTAEEQLKLMAKAYFEFAFSQRAYYELMYGLGIPSCQKAKEVKQIGNFSCTIISVLKELIAPENEQKTHIKFHTFWSILHGLTAINMVNATATPNEMQQLVLLDAVQGFIKNINN